MKHLIFCILLTVSLKPLAEGGFYIGIGAGYANLTNTPQSGYTFSNFNGNPQSSNHMASTLYFGYNYNPYIGIELDYNIAYNSSVANTYGLNQQLLAALLDLHLPFNLFTKSLNRLSVFAKIGPGYNAITFGNTGPLCNACVNPPGDANSPVLVYGGGLEYDFTNVGVRIEYLGNSSTTASNRGFNQVQVSSNNLLLSVLYLF